MQQKILLKLLPQEAKDSQAVSRIIAKCSGLQLKDITGYNILKKSLDARGKTVWINMTVTAFINEPFLQRSIPEFKFKDVNLSQKKVGIIGAGPAGLFAALRLIELGLKPVIVERGKDVKERRRDLALLNKKTYQIEKKSSIKLF